LDGTVARPDTPPPRPAGSTALTTEQVSAIKKYTKDTNQYLQEQAIAFQQIASTILNSLYLKIKGRTTIKEAWDMPKANFEKRSCMIMIELRKRLQDTWCSKNGNICMHFNTIQTMQEELTSLGTSLGEQDFSAIILGSLPRSYNQFISAVTATTSIFKQELNPEDLMQTIIDEYNRWSTRSGTKEKSIDSTFFAESNNRGKKKSDKDVKCFNCYKKEHKKVDCWAKGGGKEGQGPRSKSKKEEPKKEMASTAVEEGVWMAVVNNSNDKHMANDEFNDFTISEDNIFFSEEKEEEIQRLTNHPRSNSR
jgi:hypothetical protein